MVLRSQHSGHRFEKTNRGGQDRPHGYATHNETRRASGKFSRSGRPVSRILRHHKTRRAGTTVTFMMLKPFINNDDKIIKQTFASHGLCLSVRSPVTSLR